jgi:hypothetical protein
MNITVGTIIAVNYAEDKSTILSHEDVIDVNILFALFLRENPSIKITFIQKNKKGRPFCIYPNVDTNIDTDAIAKKFIYWLRKNGWRDLSKSIEPINFI